MSKKITTPFYGFTLFAEHATIAKGPTPWAHGQFNMLQADSSELKTERSFMDHLGVTDEIRRLRALIAALGAGTPAATFYQARLNAIIGDVEGAADDAAAIKAISDSYYGKSRQIYFDSYHQYAGKGYTLKDAEALAFKLARTQYEKDLDILNADYPPDISGLLNKNYALSELGKFSSK